MPVIRCSWGQCTSDIRTKAIKSLNVTGFQWKKGIFNQHNFFAASNEECEGDIGFYQLPRPFVKNGKIEETHEHTETSKAWVKACNRPRHSLNIEKVSHYHYICSKVSSSRLDCFSI